LPQKLLCDLVKIGQLHIQMCLLRLLSWKLRRAYHARGDQWQVT
jgi:hypothetical protein